MKNLVLLCAVFLLFLFTAESDDTNSISEAYNLINSTNLAKPGCDSRCGDLIVPYPFGIGDNCSIGEVGFDIYCNTSLNPPRASFDKTDTFSIKVISDSTIRTSNSVVRKCYLPNGTFSSGDHGTGYVLKGPYTLSQLNNFIVIGCDDYVRLTSELRFGKTARGGCMAFCPDPRDVADDCSGNGCCQSSIPKDVIDYVIQLYTTLDSNDKLDSRSISDRRSLIPCTYAFVGDPNAFKFNRLADLNDTNFEKRIEDTVPRVLEWAIGFRSCAEAKETRNFACQYSNSECVDSKRKYSGYRCVCKEGYEGNPYLSPGCKDIDECSNESNNPCHGNICTNTIGSYDCRCFPGYKGDAYNRGGCQRVGGKFPVMIFTLALVFSLVALLCGVSGTFFGIRKRKLIKLREKFFEQNGGVFLRQKLKALGTSETVIIYSTEELRKATDNYSEERIIGQGGYGVVYKGILSDKRVVAIKRSKLVDSTQAEQFINEVLILTQVIHRNVVKVLGCCLEEEVPVLVYEFISNNTLFYHIHHISGGMSWLSWENRLRVAAEAAGALGYLHSQATMPIIHRDVKSSNILLDDNYTTKISDFGASRLVPLDHNQVTTLVQGTLGYLDPEYFQTSQLTDKSDVYSFGVVLAELITGQKPLSAYRSNEEKSLATYFVKAMKENRLLEIVEPRLLGEGTLEQLQAVGDLVKRCLNLHGNDRPTMKEVTMELEGLKKVQTHRQDKERTNEETQSLVNLEVEQSDLYDVPLIQYGTDGYDSYSHLGSSNSMNVSENKTILSFKSGAFLTNSY